MLSAVVPTPGKASSQISRRKHPQEKGEDKKGAFFLLSDCQTLQNVTLFPSNFNHSGNLCIPCQEEVSLFDNKVGKGNLKPILKHCT